MENQKIKTFYIKTFGCQMNERDSEIMAQSLLSHGYKESLEMNSADWVIINTCSIRAKAEQKVMSLLGMLQKEKAVRPGLKICVAGCVAQQEGEQLLARMPLVDLVVGTQNIYTLPILLQKDTRQVVISMKESYVIPRFIPELKPFSRQDGSKIVGKSFKKFVTIMQGCNNFCSYCIVPFTRGREISRKKNDIMEEVEVLVDSGVREVTLLGQNVNSYGFTNSVTDDGSPYPFPSLLRDIASIPGLKRLRFTTSHPKDLSDDLIRCFNEIPQLCRQIHLPVQAGSNAVLKRMNRRYTVEEYRQKVDRLKQQCPDIAITTDIIVGFPGETDFDFEGTMKLLEYVRYDGSFSFKYSDRPGTRSSTLTEKISDNIKGQRLSRFQSRQDEISLEKNSGYIGKILPVMIESDTESIFGRTEFNHIVHIDTTLALKPGDIVNVKIIHAGQHSLKGVTLQLQ